jgi:hypothetical protein
MEAHNCKYCLKPLIPKVYPSGHVECDNRYYNRLYCDDACYYAGRKYFTALEKYKKMEDQRQTVVKCVKK